MILYVNGDGFTSASYAVNNFAYANDDYSKVALGTKPHPDNLDASWGLHLSRFMKLAMVCDAMHNASIDYVIRTTRAFINNLPSLGNPYAVIVIGWPNPYVVEWLDEESGEYYQVSAVENFPIPDKWRGDYRVFLSKFKPKLAQSAAHGKILMFHQELKQKEIPHMFFNASHTFDPTFGLDVDWNKCYLEPYDTSFLEWSKKLHLENERDYCTADAHARWASYLSRELTARI